MCSGHFWKPNQYHSSFKSKVIFLYGLVYWCALVGYCTLPLFLMKPYGQIIKFIFYSKLMYHTSLICLSKPPISLYCSVGRSSTSIALTRESYLYHNQRECRHCLHGRDTSQSNSCQHHIAKSKDRRKPTIRLQSNDRNKQVQTRWRLSQSNTLIAYSGGKVSKIR